MSMSQGQAASQIDPGRVWARIVIVAYRSRQELQACVDALAKQTFDGFEVVIVNNDCPEGSTDSLHLPDSRFRIVQAGANIGFAGGANLGAKGAACPWIITLNPDTVPDRHWLAELNGASQRSPQYDVLSTTLLQAKDPSKVDGFGDVLSIYGIAWRGGSGLDTVQLPQTDRPVFGACGAAAAYRRCVFEAFGGFDEDYFCYLEDVDLAFRLQAAGRECLQVRRAIAAHVGGASSASDPRFAIYQTHLNSLRLIVRNAPAAVMPFMLAAFALAQAYLVARNHSRPETAYRVSGLRDALGTIGPALASRRAARRLARLGSVEMVRRFAWSPRALRNQRLFTFAPAIDRKQPNPRA